jgi:UDP-4-amino-4,6-dideoxy-N-acetyl-beta-L-altrosamine N-acetyltransferase
MYTDHLISEAEHLAWIQGLSGDDRQLVFAVLDGAHGPVGAVSISAWDRRNRKAEWAYYLAESARGGLGSALEFAFLEFCFQTLELEKLNCEVLQGNAAVVKLHKKFLFQDEGFRRSNILKQGRRWGVHLMGLTREDWANGQAALADRYQAVFARFQISIQWAAEPPPNSTLAAGQV